MCLGSREVKYLTSSESRSVNKDRCRDCGGESCRVLGIGEHPFLKIVTTLRVKHLSFLQLFVLLFLSTLQPSG